MKNVRQSGKTCSKTTVWSNVFGKRHSKGLIQGGEENKRQVRQATKEVAVVVVYTAHVWHKGRNEL